VIQFRDGYATKALERSRNFGLQTRKGIARLDLPQNQTRKENKS